MEANMVEADAEIVGTLLELAKHAGAWILLAVYALYKSPEWLKIYLEHRRLLKRELNRHAERMKKLEVDIGRQRPKLIKQSKGGQDKNEQ
jgi:hypothetical protein